MTATTQDIQAAIAVTRFGLGARPGEIAAVRSDPQGWLKAQIQRQGADQPPGELPSMRRNFVTYMSQQKAVRAAVANPALIRTSDDPAKMQAGAQAGELTVQQARRQATAPLRQEVIEEILARVQLGAATPAGFRERWTLFWLNHFTVSAKAQTVASAVGPFEREAIRPHVFGRFQDLLTASSRHPGMLLYLDQAQSLGPHSLAASRRAAGGGLNENLAREIMELHTVGADAGYTQADVTEFARALTGWSMVGQGGQGGEPGVFIYRATMHEPGGRTVLGRRYNGEGEDQAQRILVDLANDPRTARRIARKIAVHFVSDDPPPALTGRLEQAWIHSGGDLGVVAEALVSSPEAWEPQAAKLKTPYEFLVSGYRAADAAPRDPTREVVNPLTVLGQRPYSAPQPNGWSDQAVDWAAPDAIVKRLTWAQGFAKYYAPAVGAPADVAEAALGARLSATTSQAVARAETRPEAFAILLMSPEFQRR